MPNRDVLAQFADQLIDMATEMKERVAAPPAERLPGLSAAGVPLAEVAAALMAQRRSRRAFFPPSLFHEPAWEILLNLFVAHEEGRTLNVKHLVGFIDAPATTSQRWIDQLVHMKLLNRVADPHDRRRLEISLTEAAAGMMARYLRSLVDATAPEPL